MSTKAESARTETVARTGHRPLPEWLTAAAFLAPALIVVGSLLIYPILYTFVRSTFDSTGTNFVGLSNYREVFTEPRTLIAFRNNLIWVVIAPMVVTFLGLIFAVVSQRIAWRSAFRMALFMPLVVSGLAAGVTFRFVYSLDPEVGVANAIIGSVIETFRPSGEYSGARPSQPSEFEVREDALFDTRAYEAGDMVHLGLVGIPPFRLPDSAAPAQAPPVVAPGQIEGVTWLDFSPGGDAGSVDSAERGLPGVRVQMISDGNVISTAVSDDRGRFTFDSVPEGESVHLALAASNFRQPFGGIPWLGPLLITPAIILGYIWIQTGFALIVIGAGLAGIDRELQDSARVEGAGEFQVFRFITVPLLRPILLVVFVTTVISVLKVFDLVLVIAPESVQYYANVLSLEMWRASFGGARDFGLGSALAALLFVLIIPAMLFNLRRFRME